MTKITKRTNDQNHTIQLEDQKRRHKVPTGWTLLGGHDIMKEGDKMLDRAMHCPRWTRIPSYYYGKTVMANLVIRKEDDQPIS